MLLVSRTTDGAGTVISLALCAERRVKEQAMTAMKHAASRKSFMVAFSSIVI
jgi:hypothetical protein